jgi:soluble P-type ATPase
VLEIDIPGYKKLRIEHLVLDYNGTIACDGELVDGVRERLEALSKILTVHVLTADTFGGARSGLEGVPCKLEVLPPGRHALAKRNYVEKLGPEKAICIGNGRNDQLMLKSAEVGIAVVLEEGTAVEAVKAADVLCAGATRALDLLLNPKRLIATLRS